MTRRELLHLLVGQARTRGFDFRQWFSSHSGMAWTTYANALDWLATAKRANLLVLSHSFAQQFFQSGEKITYLVPPQTFERVTTGGERRTVKRKAHLRHSSREDVWRFHLREMAAAAEPLRYIRRFLVIEESMREIANGMPEEPSYDDENLVRESDG